MDYKAPNVVCFQFVMMVSTAHGLLILRDDVIPSPWSETRVGCLHRAPSGKSVIALVELSKHYFRIHLTSRFSEDLFRKSEERTVNLHAEIRRFALPDLWASKLALSLAMLMIGCDGESGPDPSIKVEAGKSVEESTTKSGARPGVAPKDAAPIQRTKAAPG